MTTCNCPKTPCNCNEGENINEHIQKIKSKFNYVVNEANYSLMPEVLVILE